MTRRLLILAAIITLALPQALLAAGGATAIQVRQPATMSADGKRFSKLKLGALLSSGAILRTGEGGQVLLLLADGSKAALGPNSDLALRRLPQGVDPVRATLSLFKGRLRALVRHLSGRSSFRIETQNAVVAVKGTDVETEAGDDKDGKDKTDVKVLDTDGKGVELSDLEGKDKTDLGKGEESSADRHGVEDAHELSSAERQELINRYAGMDMSPPAPREPGAGSATGQGSAALAAKALQRVDKLIAAIEKKGGDTKELKALRDDLSNKVEAAAQKEEEGSSDEAARKYEGALAALLETQPVKEGSLPEGALDELKGLRDAAVSERTAQEQLEHAVDELLQQGESQRLDVGAEEPAVEEPQGQSSPQEQVVAAVNEELQQAAETLEQAQQDLLLEQQADNAQGSMLMDKDGYRTQVNALVTQPDPNTVHRAIYSRRDEGPNAGVTEFHHTVIFNHDVHDNWPYYFSIGLMDAANFDAQSNFITWRVEDKLQIFNPSQDCFCYKLAHVDPNDPLSDYNEYLQVNGVARSFRQLFFDGTPTNIAGNTDLNVAVSAVGSGFRFDYTALSGAYVGPIVSFLVQPVNLDGGSFSLGSLVSSPTSLRDLALADFSQLPTGAGLELTITSPDFGTREISPLFLPVAFGDSFREGWHP